MQSSRKPESKAMRQPKQDDAPKAEVKTKVRPEKSAPAKVNEGHVIRVHCPNVGSRRMSSDLGIGEAFANPMPKGTHRCTVCCDIVPNASHPVVR